MNRAAALPVDELFAEPELAFLAAVGYRRIGETSRALELLARVEPEARRRGERRLLLEVINLVGNALFESGRMADAEERYSELLETSTTWDDEEGKARAANNLGVLANVRGRRDLALTCYQRALAAYQRLGNVRGLAETHHNLGISYRDLGFDRDADTHFSRAAELSEEAGLEDVIALAEAERAGLRVRWRDGRLAGEMARRALERFQRISDPTGAAQAIRIMGLAALAEGDADEAEARLTEALEIARAHDDALLHAEVQRDRGMLLRDRGDAGAAREALTDAAEHFQLIGAAAEAEALRVMISALP
ncbi:MAG TPA: tetratricopeptide repeat protein [Longimicrobium sp.]|nr:tetratricopeptide repeat protein [Longimicrobium sp.]